MATNFITRITDAAEKVILSRAKNINLLNEYYNRSDKRIGYKRQAVTLEKKEVKDWKLAIMSFTDPDNPRRGLLMRFYDSLKLDLHLGSCIDQRILPIQCAKFKLVNEKGEEDTEAHKLLDKPWFLELIRLVVKSTFDGTTLIELFEVNEKGEVKEVAEIPQSNFLANKGIIINEEMDDNGTSYKEGVYKNYYIQIGSDNSIGLLNQLSMIILAKKLGLGSWMSYIEKFGIPPVFITTDRIDRTRIDELFEMLTNFKSAFFAVLQGNEKVETQTNSGVDGYQSFKALHEVCDNAISKRLLGGTGTTDEKSFVGSSEVHERQLQMRNKVDKLLFKFYFNEEIKPRLVSLSSVYAPLANLTFDFDDKETLTLKETIELIKSLSQYYEFDIDELVKITGLPITAVKSAMGITTSEPDPQKKKPEARLRSYSGLRLAPFAQAEFNLQAATWDAATEKLAKQIYKGEVKPSDLDRDLVLKNYAAFNKEAETAWGNGYYESEKTRSFRENMLKFSGRKAYSLMSDLKKAKVGLSEVEYIKAAKNIVFKHNETWLATEKKFVANSASSARDFESYLKDEDIYPNLKNRTMQDGDVRHSHAINDGVIKPLRDWKAIPPYDPGCRCWLEQTDEPVTADRNIQNLDVKWANNPALSGKIFTEKHNYFTQIDDKSSGIVTDNTEQMKVFLPYNRVSSVDNNKIFINDFYDLKDGDQNIKIAKIISKGLKKDIFIRPHIINSDKSSVKNPEFGIGFSNNIGDLKTYDPEQKHPPKNTSNFVHNSIDTANDQKCSVVILDCTLSPENNYLFLAAKKLRGIFLAKQKPNIQEVVIVRDEKAMFITRKQIISKNCFKYFKFD